MNYYLLRSIVEKPFTVIDLVATSNQELIDLELDSNPMVVDEDNLPEYRYGICLKLVQNGDIIDAPQTVIDEAIASEPDLSKDPANDDFLGTFDTLENLQIAHPEPKDNSFAYIDAGVGSSIEHYLWDTSDGIYVKQAGVGGSAPTPSETIASVDSGLGNEDWKTKLTPEEVRDIVGALLQAGTHTNITVEIDDVNDKINLTASGGAGLSDEQVEDIVGGLTTQGTGISVNYDDNNNLLTVSLTGESFTTLLKTKLDAVQAGAEVNRTDIEMVALLDAYFGDILWRSQLSNSEVVAAIDAVLGNTDWKSRSSATQIIALVDGVLGTAWKAKLTNSEVVAAIDAELGHTDWKNPLSQEQIEDIVAALLQAGTHTNVTVDYDDVNNKINLTASTGGAGLSDEEVEDIVGGLTTQGTGINVNYDDASNTLIISLTGESFTTAYKNKLDLIEANAEVNHTDVEIIALVDGVLGVDWKTRLTNAAVVSAIDAELGHVDWKSKLTTEEVQDIVAALLQAGTHTNVTVDYDDVNNKINLTASTGGSSLTDEEVEDIVGGLTTQGTGINVSYDDANNTLIISLTGESFTTAHKNKLDLIEANADVTDAENIASSIEAATSKTTPVDADEIPLIDSAASNSLKKLSWLNIKATLKTYFDTIYATISSVLTKTNTTAFTPTADYHPATKKYVDDNGGGGAAVNHTSLKGLHPIHFGAELAAQYQWYGNAQQWGMNEDGALDVPMITTTPTAIVPPVSDIANNFVNGMFATEDGTLDGFTLTGSPRHGSMDLHLGIEIRRHTYDVDGNSTGFTRISMWYNETPYRNFSTSQKKFKKEESELGLAFLAGDQICIYEMCSNRGTSSWWSELWTPIVK